MSIVYVLRRVSEDLNSLQRTNFFAAVTLPIVMPHVFLYGSALGYVTLAEFLMVRSIEGTSFRPEESVVV